MKKTAFSPLNYLLKTPHSTQKKEKSAENTSTTDMVTEIETVKVKEKSDVESKVPGSTSDSDKPLVVDPNHISLSERYW